MHQLSPFPWSLPLHTPPAGAVARGLAYSCASGSDFQVNCTRGLSLKPWNTQQVTDGLNSSASCPPAHPAGCTSALRYHPCEIPDAFSNPNRGCIFYHPVRSLPLASGHQSFSARVRTTNLCDLCLKESRIKKKKLNFFFFLF